MEKGLAVGHFDNVCRSDTHPVQQTDPVSFGRVFLGEGQIITEGPR